MQRDFPISAIYRDTPLEPLGVLALPGVYTVKLTVNGATLARPLTLRMDPRAEVTPIGLRQQFALAMKIADMMNRTFAAATAASGGSGEASRTAEHDALVALNGDLATAYDVVEGADRAPTAQATRAVRTLQQRFEKVVR
jgi:hypothetical protein